MKVVEPEEPPKFGELRIDRAAQTLSEALLKFLLDVAGEPRPRELRAEVAIKIAAAGTSHNGALPRQGNSQHEGGRTYAEEFGELQKSHSCIPRVGNQTPPVNVWGYTSHSLSLSINRATIHQLQSVDNRQLTRTNFSDKVRVCPIPAQNLCDCTRQAF